MQDPKNSSKHILVTGGAGFIGSNVCRAFLEGGAHVYAVDNFITGKKENLDALDRFERFRFFEMDVVMPKFRTAFAKIPVQEIYHAACPTGVPNIERMAEEMLKTSSLGTLNALEVARRHNAKFLFTSSCEIYGSPRVFPQHEHYEGNVNPIGPRSAYEEGKRFAEALVAMYVRKHKVSGKIVRFFNIYGTGMSLEDHRVIPQFLRFIIAGQPLRIYGSGTQKRTFLYVDDLVRGIQLVMEHGAVGEAYNIGSTTEITMSELASLAIRLTDHGAGIVYHPHFIEDHERRQPGIDKIQALGWRQKITLEDGLRRMIDAYGVKNMSASNAQDVAHKSHAAL